LPEEDGTLHAFFALLLISLKSACWLHPKEMEKAPLWRSSSTSMSNGEYAFSVIRLQ